MTPTLRPRAGAKRQNSIFDRAAGLLREAPSLCSVSEERCRGCGKVKTYRGRPSSSLVCCSECWRKLPKWLRDAFRNEGGAKWENRIAATLIWSNESDHAVKKSLTGFANLC